MTANKIENIVNLEKVVFSFFPLFLGIMKKNNEKRCLAHVKRVNVDFFSQRHKGTQSICLISSLLPKNLRFFRDFYRLKKRHRTKALCPLRSLCLCEKIFIHTFDVVPGTAFCTGSCGLWYILKKGAWHQPYPS